MIRFPSLIISFLKQVKTKEAGVHNELMFRTGIKAVQFSFTLLRIIHTIPLLCTSKTSTAIKHNMFFLVIVLRTITDHLKLLSNLNPLYLHRRIAPDYHYNVTVDPFKVQLYTPTRSVLTVPYTLITAVYH